MKTTVKFTIIMLCIVSAIISSCKKMLEIPESKSQVENSIVFSDSTIAVSALLGAYYTMGTVNTSMKFVSIYADEYTFTSRTALNIEYGTSQLLVSNVTNASLWNNLFSVIYQCNALLEGLVHSERLSEKAKKQISAEAKFLRAYSNFYLVNLYDNIPLILTTDVNINRRAAQFNGTKIYDQIIKDLTESKATLGTAYQGVGKVRANSFAAAALLARVYLYLNNWEQASREASFIIDSGQFSADVKLEDIFLAGSNEAILQFWTANGVISDVAQLVPASSTALPTYPITENFYQSFENIDGRRSKWVGTNNVTTGGQTVIYRYPSKYKNRVTNTAKPEFVMALRLTEQYLIRAEALAQLDHISGAVNDVNIIRIRAGLVPLEKSINKQVCLEKIKRERKLELFGEWGHRFLDLKRIKQLDNILGALKPTWKPEIAKAFPIPNNEIIYNSTLIQNHGY